jgi:hypothetical protein
MDIVSKSAHEGREVLAIATGMSEHDAARSKLSQVITAPALVIDAEGAVARWTAEGTYCDAESGNLVIWGPAFPGPTLLASARSTDRKSAWANLHRVASTIKKAHISGAIDDETLRSIATAGPEAIVCGTDGRVLVIPAELYLRALSSLGEEVNAENRAFWVHPDANTLNAAWSFAFLAGTLAYRVVTGHVPFPVPERVSGEDGTALEMIARNIGQGIFEPVELACWNIKKQAADSINALISATVAASTDTLLAFGPDYAALFDPTKAGTEAPNDFIEKKRTAKRRRDATVDRESFIRRHKRSFGIGAIVTLFLGLLAGIYFHDLAARPTTRGLAPERIVRGFYAAIARLDQETPTAYSGRGVKEDYADMLASLFVTVKMRQTYERDNPLLSPQELFRGQEAAGKTIFGISRLEIATQEESAREVRYAVSYYLWLPVDPPSEESAGQGDKTEVKKGESGTTAATATSTTGKAAEDTATATPAYPPLSVYQYREMVTLTRGKDRWLIEAIEPTARTLVVSGSQAVLSALSSGEAGSEPWAPFPGESLEP